MKLANDCWSELLMKNLSWEEFKEFQVVDKPKLFLLNSYTRSDNEISYFLHFYNIYFQCHKKYIYNI